MKMELIQKSYQIILLAFMVSLGLCAEAQTSISAKATIWGTTFGKNTSPSGLMPGGILGIEKYLGSPYAGIKLSQSAVRTDPDNWAFSTHFLFKMRFYHRKHALIVGLGPALFVQNATTVHEDDWSPLGQAVSKVVWTSGEIEYTYYLDPHWKLLLSIDNPAHQTLTFSAGMLLTFRAKKKSCDCPSFGH